jgi:flavin-binding protein dodecin
MHRLLLRASFLALALAAPLGAAEKVSRAQVLSAIKTFDANLAGSLVNGSTAAQDDAVAKASNTILKFSLESDEVVVDLGLDAVPWVDVKKGLATLSNSGARGLLLAAYLSGCVHSQLAAGKQDPNPYAGWVSMLKVYRALKMREGVKIPEVESLLAHQADGSLAAYAAGAMQRSADTLRRTYGQPAAKQILTASAQP